VSLPVRDVVHKILSESRQRLHAVPMCYLPILYSLVSAKQVLYVDHRKLDDTKSKMQLKAAVSRARRRPSPPKHDVSGRQDDRAGPTFIQASRCLIHRCVHACMYASKQAPPSGLGRFAILRVVSLAAPHRQPQHQPVHAHWPKKSDRSFLLPGAPPRKKRALVFPRRALPASGRAARSI
jgi:hypothetical protein